MKRFLAITSALLLLPSIQSCLRDESEYFPHFIESYYAMDSISINSDKVSIGTEKYFRLTIQVNSYEWIADKSRIEQLSTKHKDYDGGHWATVPHNPTVCLDNDIKGINVVALEDWDGRYEKGDCLNASCHIVAGSLYPYILNGYKELDITGSPSEFVSYASEGLYMTEASLVDTALTSLTPDDMILLNGQLNMKLFDLFIPDTKTTGTCDIRVELTDDSGRNYSATILLE